MDQAPEEQRPLNLPALQPMNFGDASGLSVSSTAPSARFSLTLHPPQSSAKHLGKRPSTATLAQSPGPLLPASRPVPPRVPCERIGTKESQSEQDVRPRKSGTVGTNVTSGLLPHEEVIDGGPSNPQQLHYLPQGEPTQTLPISQRDRHELNDESYDWGSFVQAYAAGKWDPRHTPNPPRNHERRGPSSDVTPPIEDALNVPPFLRPVTSTSIDTLVSRKRSPGTSSSSSIHSRLSLGTSRIGSDKSAGSTSTAASSGLSAHSLSTSESSSASQPATPPLSLIMRREKSHKRSPPESLHAPGNFLQPLPELMMHLPPRGPLGRSLSDSSPVLVEEAPRPNVSESQHDFRAAAATMRLAGDGNSVRPLSLPSPEVELTDPLRGQAALLPLPWAPDEQHGREPTMPVGSLLEAGTSSRKKRLNSFWDGLGDVAGGSTATDIIACAETGATPAPHGLGPTGLPTISASPLNTPDMHPHEEIQNRNTFDLGSFLPTQSFPPASAPLPQGSQKPSSGDYFGDPASQRLGESSMSASVAPLPPQDQAVCDRYSSTRITEYLPVFETSPASLSSSSSTGSVRPPAFHRTVSEPVVTCSTHPEETSLDPASDHESSSTRPKSDLSRFSPRKVRQEAEYSHRGYLVPPQPPNEWDRQRALYRFNIVHTAKDANFDRIALLAKLVFNAKICLISLIDADEQWFKSEFGLGRESSSRDESICGHTILQDSPEPLVILDTNLDWRFTKSPFVVMHPFTRFYAGAPLRTSEGFNIGSLCIIDSEPRSEFGPRQRHTLKEFAAIVMRELELWRDKIQLRIRDRIQTSMEQFTRECLEIDTQAQKGDPRLLLSSTSMERIYDRAAKLVKRTLDVEGAVLIDVSNFEEFDTPNAETALSVLLYHSDPKQGPQSKPLTPAGFAQMAQFFKDFPDGKVSEAVLPACIRGLMPGNIHYALTVPILNIDKRPFALLCAYNTNAKSKLYLEGHELSYLRAIGVIILSAVLKRRMILADKAKSLFISNISHELRTPLHGILAAAELLTSTDLTPNQASFLNTVQACGTSLVETVNHVLDFTKLSGSTKAGGIETVIRPARVDLAQLVEEATEGCWIGHRARHSSEIGSVYSPRNEEDADSQDPRLQTHVETVVDIGYRPQGWMVICEKGGIRRCLMNLLGNALKFTTDGYVHVTLRQLPINPNSPEDRVKLELGVLDSGKGISEDFLKNQLFQPFSQENPLQPGTGLGLAIVNSIVRSESVNGKIDVWSAEHSGTEIRIIFEAELVPAERTEVDEPDDWQMAGFAEPLSASLLGFTESRGHRLLKQVITEYIEQSWKFVISPVDSQLGDILILNEDVELVRRLTQQRDCGHPVVVLSSTRGDPYVLNAVEDYQRAGGFARIVFKPVGPNSLRQVIGLCVRILVDQLTQQQSTPNRTSLSSIEESTAPSGERYSARDFVEGVWPSPLNRRRSQGAEGDLSSLRRPELPPRSRTYNLDLSSGPRQPSTEGSRSEPPKSPNSPSTTIAIGTGGLLLKTSIGSLEPGRPVHVLVIEDNSILRELLVKWLRSKGYIVREAADGQNGVDIFKSEATFDVVLLDMSMPVLDGVGAATEIRRLEQEHTPSQTVAHPTGSNSPRTSRLIALTGMSSREDKRRAFEAGVDGYLVKPVSFKTLQLMFKQLGIT